MRKVLLSIIAILLVANIYAASTIFIMNTTSNYTMYYNFDAAHPSNCYPKIQVTGTNCSYLTILPYGSVFFSNFSDLSSWYSGLEYTLMTTSSANPTMPNASQAGVYLSMYGLDWSLIRYKGEDANQNGDGVWIGFPDFSSCHGETDYWSGSYTTGWAFSLNGDKYFVMS